MVRRSIVEPVARALALLGAFRPNDCWLTNRDLSLRTGLPPSTVSRQTHGLVELGYLRHAPSERKYALAASVLSLGYAAIAHTQVQQLSRVRMQALAQTHQVHVVLCTRERMDLLIVECETSPSASIPQALHVGARLELGASPTGWAMLAALPEVERYYLLEKVERRAAKDWPRLRRRISEAMSQVMEFGYCTSLGEWDPELSLVASPLMVPGYAPLAIACIGASTYMSSARVRRELGPQLVGMTLAIQEEAGAIS